MLCILILNNVIAKGQTESSQNFYVNLSAISTIGNATIGDIIRYYPNNLLDVGVYCGNDFKVSEKLRLSLEFYYLNNKLVIAKEGDERFELHQNLGVSLKPGVRYGYFSSYLIVGINAVYLFDKNEATGHQIDRFDDSFFLGIEQNYHITDNLKLTLGYAFSKFQCISFYTSSTLNSFHVVKLGLGYSFY
jgi:opacity protein-like surface antigen